ncbi:MAG: substrate-binding domain-containing protein [Spirochaetales bacterium]|nr:substrate-binding domain-containing protein [Spirochaetales bacterium]
MRNNPEPNFRRLTLGLLIDLGSPIYQTRLFEGIEEYCREADVNLLCFDVRAFASIKESAKRHSFIINLINKKNIDGLLCIAGAIEIIDPGKSPGQFLKRLHPLPMVTIGFSSQKLPAVIEKTRKGIKEMLLHLTREHNFSKIALLCGSGFAGLTAGREKEVLKVFSSLHIVCDPKLVIAGDFSIESGRQAITELIDTRKARFDAIISCNDRMAIGAIEELLKRGIAVPGKIAVTAFEDEKIAQYFALPLTAIVPPHYEMGARAAQLCISQLTGNEPAGMDALTTSLIVRESCGCVVTDEYSRIDGEKSLLQFHFPFGKKIQELTIRLMDVHTEITSVHREQCTIKLSQAVKSIEKSIAETDPEFFIHEWSQLLHILEIFHYDTSLWIPTLLLIRNTIVRELTSLSDINMIEKAFHRAELLTAEKAKHQAVFQHLLSEQRAKAFRAIEDKILPVLSIDEIIAILYGTFPGLGITSCFFSLSDQQDAPLHYSTLLAAIYERKNIDIKKRTCHFLTNRLLPPGMFPDNSRITLIVEALCDTEKQIGIILLGMDDYDLDICTHLSKRLSNAVHNALHLQTINEARVDLETQVSLKTMDILELGKKLQREIHERERLNAELRQSEVKYKKWFDDDFTGNFIAAANGDIIACNEAFAHIFGFDSIEEAMGSNYGNFYPNRSALEDFFTLLSVVKRIAYYEAEFIRQDGQSVHIIGNIIGTFDDDDNLIEIQGFLFDNTERKHLEAELRQSHKMEAIGRLAGGIAHDFNNLLTGIMGYSELLRQKLPPYDPGRNDIEEIKKAAKSAASLTRQLLAFSRKQVLQPTVLDLNTVIRQLKDMLKRIIGEHIQLSTELAEPLYLVKADQGQIEQVILNLTINSRDALPNGGSIIISTKNADIDTATRVDNPDIKPGSYVILEVRDNGQGMDDETQSHIFEPFYTTKHDGQGIGLGLSTVYGIITQSGGFPEVLSELDKGTTMRVYLPLFGKALPETEPIFDEEESVKSNATILLVEDEDFVRELASKVLSHSSFHVISAHNGKEALSLVKKHSDKIDMLITDVVMPGMNGLELSKKLLAIRPNLKIIFMSGYTDNVITQEESLYTELNYIQKPFTPDVFLKQVEKVLKN